jgi:hypothetical protein
MYSTAKITHSLDLPDPVALKSSFGYLKRGWAITEFNLLELVTVKDTFRNFIKDNN